MSRRDTRTTYEASTADLVLRVAQTVDTCFEKYGYVIKADEALQSSQVTGCLLKMGLFSLNLTSMARMSDPESNHYDPGIEAKAPDLFRQGVLCVPENLIGIAVHHALEVAPDIGDQSMDNVINVNQLEAHVEKLEAIAGEIRIDKALVHEIGRASVRALQTQPTRTPE